MSTSHQKKVYSLSLSIVKLFLFIVVDNFVDVELRPTLPLLRLPLPLCFLCGAGVEPACEMLGPIVGRTDETAPTDVCPKEPLRLILSFIDPIGSAIQASLFSMTNPSAPPSTLPEFASDGAEINVGAGGGTADVFVVSAELPALIPPPVLVAGTCGAIVGAELLMVVIGN